MNTQKHQIHHHPEHAVRPRDRAALRSVTAMTLVEFVLCAALATATLGLLLTISTSSRANAAYHHTRQSLLTPHHALLEYHNQYGHYLDEPASTVIATLLRDPVTAPILGPVPLRKISNSTIADGDGQPIKYIGPKNSDTDQPDFISAGPDGRFRYSKTDDRNASHATIDNLYASDMEAVQ